MGWAAPTVSCLWPSRAITESFGKSGIHGPKHFCDLCRDVPRHDHSDQVMSFQERVFDTFHFCDFCRGCTGMDKSFPSVHFLIFRFWFFDSRSRAWRRKPGPPKKGSDTGSGGHPHRSWILRHYIGGSVMTAGSYKATIFANPMVPGWMVGHPLTPTLELNFQP